MTAGEVVYDWWRALVPDDQGTKAFKGHQRAALARLRRAGDVINVLMEPEALRLIQRLPNHQPDRVATVAGVLAFVTPPHEAVHVIRSVGRTAFYKDKSATLSEKRFRRLMQLQADDLLDPMRRLVRLNKRHANVGDLAESILFWGDSVKKRWIFEYYGVETVAAREPTGSAASDVRNGQNRSSGERT